MIEEAEVDYAHTWSSIRHPATQMPRGPGRRNRPGPQPNQRYQPLPVVTEEIQHLSQLHISSGISPQNLGTV
jgi:hypothetical protein